MIRLRETLSPSRLSLWLSCRLKFWFKYVRQILKPPTPAMFCGSIAHHVLQRWNLARWRREPFDATHWRSLFDSRWKAEQKDKAIDWQDEEAESRDSTLSVLAHYLSNPPSPAEERPEAVEVKVEADLARHGLPRLVGVLDLVRAGGRIVDFKLVGKKPTPATLTHLHEIQLSTYGLLYRDATGKREGGLELHHLIRTREPKTLVTALEPMSERQETRLLRQIESYLAGLERQDFVPSPGFHCAGCEYFAESRRWHGQAEG